MDLGFKKANIESGIIKIDEKEISNIDNIVITNKSAGNGIIFACSAKNFLEQKIAGNLQKPIFFANTLENRKNLFQETIDINNDLIFSLEAIKTVNSLVGGVPSPTLPVQIDEKINEINARIEILQQKLEELI